MFVQLAINKRPPGRTLTYMNRTIHASWHAGELPSGLEKVSFVWERGAKMFITDAEAVNPHTRAAFWKQYLRQVCYSIWLCTLLAAN